MKALKSIFSGLLLGALTLGAGVLVSANAKEAKEAKADVNVVGEFTISKFETRDQWGNLNEMMFFYVVGTDYPQVDGEDATTFNLSISDSIIEESGFWNHVKFGEEGTSISYVSGESQLNRFQRWPCFQIMSAGGGNYDKVTISEGALIPSYSYVLGGAASYYSLKFDYTFTIDSSAHNHVAETDSLWNLSGTVSESLIAGEFSLKDLYTVRAYSGDPANANELLMVRVNGTDYPDLDGAESDQQLIADAKFPFLSSFFVMGTNTVPEMYGGQTYLNYWQRHKFFTCCPLGLFNYNTLTIKKGLLIPSYTYIKGGAESYYRLATTYTATRVGNDPTLNAENAWTFVGEPYYVGQLKARRNGEGYVIGNTIAQHPDWDGNRVHCIFAIDDIAGWDWNAVGANIDASTLVGDDYTENILFDGVTLKQLNAEGKIYRMLKVNSIGYSQFGVVFESEDYSPSSIELRAGTKIPAADGVGYYLTKMHIVEYLPLFGFFDCGRDDGVDDFVKNYMHLEDVSTSDPGTGKCISEGWYADAKAAFMTLEGYEKAAITIFDTFNDAEARLAAWAAANGDQLVNYDIVPASPARLLSGNQKANNTLTIVIICVSCALMTTGLLLVIKRKKHFSK
ncbi:MAG: hypothetical protein IKP50_06665 [Bacilli bacterium]|nr:hypothetical protein [Bacilli bacterium]